MSDKTFEDKIEQFIQRNFPQIAMHGGSFDIIEADVESGQVVITLSGACSGCGISPMTIQAIKRRMTEDITEVTEVMVTTGSMASMGVQGGGSGGRDDGMPDAPF